MRSEQRSRGCIKDAFPMFLSRDSLAPCIRQRISRLHWQLVSPMLVLLPYALAVHLACTRMQRTGHARQARAFSASFAY